MDEKSGAGEVLKLLADFILNVPVVRMQLF
jgi:hypothetical protein